jgi:hypothetical protein
LRHCGEQQLPPLGVATQEKGVRKRMAGDMVLWIVCQPICSTVTRVLSADRIETYPNPRDLIRCEAGLPPREGELRAGFQAETGVSIMVAFGGESRQCPAMTLVALKRKTMKTTPGRVLEVPVR